MGEQMDFDTLLKFINELSGQIDLKATLRDAEALCICVGEIGTPLVPPGTLYSQQDDMIGIFSGARFLSRSIGNEMPAPLSDGYFSHVVVS